MSMLATGLPVAADLPLPDFREPYNKRTTGRPPLPTEAAGYAWTGNRLGFPHYSPPILPISFFEQRKAYAPAPFRLSSETLTVAKRCTTRSAEIDNSLLTTLR